MLASRRYNTYPRKELLGSELGGSSAQWVGSSVSVVRKHVLAEYLVEQVEPLAYGWKRKKKKEEARAPLSSL